MKILTAPSAHNVAILKIIGKVDPCDKLLIKPDDGLDVRQTN